MSSSGWIVFYVSGGIFQCFCNVKTSLDAAAFVGFKGNGVNSLTREAADGAAWRRHGRAEMILLLNIQRVSVRRWTEGRKVWAIYIDLKTVPSIHVYILTTI